MRFRARRVAVRSDLCCGSRTRRPPATTRAPERKSPAGTIGAARRTVARHKARARAFLTVTVLLFAPTLVPAQNSNVTSFNKAKRMLEQSVYAEHRTTFYCRCAYGPDKRVDHSSCGYVPRKASNKRAHRIEWEHVVPAEAFGQSFAQWRDGDPQCIDRRGRAFKGRNCARKAATVFRYMEADLYNLVPAIGEVNQYRSNYSMTELPGEPRQFGACDVEIHDHKIEPAGTIRGEIARTYLYMDTAYPGRGIVSSKNRKLYEAWSRMDPVDRWECERARRIARVQGNENRVVADLCRAAGL